MEHFVEFEDVCKYYQTGSVKIAAADHLNFYVDKGEFCIIVGPSGAGKTTLLNILAALDKPTAGSVVLDGRELSKVGDADAAAFRRDNLGFVFQEFNLLDTFSLEDNIALPLVLAGKGYREINERLMPVARRLGIAELLKKYPYEVSGGQKQRAAVARAIITEPKLLLLDEPAAGMNPNETEELMHTIHSVRDQFGVAILLIERDMNFVMGICEEITVLDYGRVIARGDGKAIRNNPKVIAAYLGGD